MSDPMSGKNYLRALAYALKAVPADDEQAGLQHVTYHGGRVTGADRTRRHDGYLPAEVDTVSVARGSAQELVMALEYALRVSKRRINGTFSVQHHGDEVHVEYGARHPLIHKLAVVDVGGHPQGPNEWVPADAPLNPGGIGHVDCGSFKEAVSWWKSWDKDFGTCEVRGGHDGGPIRVDVTSGGARVATSFILPMDHPEAEFSDTLPLFDGVAACGRSNLDLDLSGDGVKDDGAQSIKVGDIEFNVSGLGDPSDLLMMGPCDHRDTATECVQCTAEKIESAKRAKLLVEANEAPGGKKRGKRAKLESVPDAP